MKITFGYDDIIYNGNVTCQRDHYYYNSNEDISVPINGHSVLHRTFSRTSNEKYGRIDHLTVSDYQCPIDTVVSKNGIAIERNSVTNLINQNKKFIYTISPKYLIRLHSNVIPGALRYINNKKLQHFNYLKAVLTPELIDSINANKCFFIICDLMECSWYTCSMLESLKLMCIEVGINYEKILILTSNINNIDNIHVKQSRINVCYWQYWETATKYILQESNIPSYNTCKPSKYKFLLLNSRPRRHRYYLCYKLWQKDRDFFKNFCVSLDKITISNLQTCHDYAARDGYDNSIEFFNNLSIEGSTNLNEFLSLLPFITTYDKQFIETGLNDKLLSKQYICNFNNKTKFFKVDHWDNVPSEMIYDTDIHIVTESLMEIKNTENYRHLFLTEKIFKPIALKAPFIIAAQPGALAHLRNCGYKTFFECWDEGYDAISDPQERLDAIVKLLLSLISLPSVDYIKIIKNAYEIAEYNYQVFLNRAPEQHVIERLTDFYVKESK